MIGPRTLRESIDLIIESGNMQRTTTTSCMVLRSLASALQSSVVVSYTNQGLASHRIGTRMSAVILRPAEGQWTRAGRGWGRSPAHWM